MADFSQEFSSSVQGLGRSLVDEAENKFEGACKMQGRMEISFFSSQSGRVFEDKGKFRRRPEWFWAWPLGHQWPMQPNIQSTGGTKIVNIGTNVRHQQPIILTF